MAQWPFIQAVGFGEADQAVPLQVFAARRVAMPAQVLRAGQHAPAAVIQRSGMQAGVRQVTDADGQVGTPLEQVDDAVVAVQLQLDLRVTCAKLADQRNDHVQHEGRGSVDAQAPGGCLATQGHLLLGLLHAGEDAPGLGEKQLALLGQLQASRGTAQQGHRELFFQAAEGAADAGGGLLQLFGGGADRAAVDHADEGEHFFQAGLHC